mmetsp:Transcript_6013/g.8853  ORF Transcript_6013/g.8853 Transcript_6013/m.8853 type:complete len:315 (+) Transcript_6013:43-987(+)
MIAPCTSDYKQYWLSSGYLVKNDSGDNISGEMAAYERTQGEKSKSLNSKPSEKSYPSLKGLLEKRSSDGSWKVQYFIVHKYKLYYHEPGVDPRTTGARASLDLAQVVKVERSGNKLFLFVDQKRKHQLRSVQNETNKSGGPTLDAWEDVIVESIEGARLLARAKRRAAKDTSQTQSKTSTPPITRQFSEPPNESSQRRLGEQQNIQSEASLVDDPLHEVKTADDPDEFNMLTTSSAGNIDRLSGLMDEEDDDPDTYEIDHDHYRQLIIEFYQQTNPDKVADVDTLISKYRDIGVNEADLLAAIQNKYEKMRLIR